MSKYIVLNFSLYLTENTAHLLYKYKSINTVEENIHLQIRLIMQSINHCSLRGQNAVIWLNAHTKQIYKFSLNSVTLLRYAVSPMKTEKETVVKYSINI